MSYWGKLLGGVAGFVMGGPLGAVMGAAMGHAADGGALPRLDVNGLLAAGGRDQVFAVSVVVLAAKLAKCDGPVVRAEIDAFKRQFRIPPESVRDVGRLFDSARESPEHYQAYADGLGRSFAANKGLLEDVLAALFAIARADKPLTVAEHDMLRAVHQAFGLDQLAWDQARGAAARPHAGSWGGSAGGGGGAVAGEDAYAVLGVARGATAEALRAAWLRQVRENHPDSLAARGVPPEFIARASEKVARINAAWDRIKRERGL